MKKPKVYFGLWLLLAIGYMVVSYLAPISHSQEVKYHLSHLAIHWIDLSITLPIMVILWAAYVAYDSLSAYHQRVGKTADGQAFKYVAIGLGIFAYLTLITAIVDSIINWLAINRAGFLADSTRITTYLSLIVPLLAFSYIFIGVSRLVNIGKLKIKDLHLGLVVLITAILGASYAFITLHSPHQGISALTGTKAYFMPNWLVLISVVIPYVFAWSLGVLSIIQILAYRQKAIGLLYRQMLDLLADGLGVVLLGYIAIEYLTSLANEYSFKKLDWLLLIIYILLVVVGIGYLLIAVGSRRLSKIEEV